MKITGFTGLAGRARARTEIHLARRAARLARRHPARHQTAQGSDPHGDRCRPLRRHGNQPRRRRDRPCAPAISRVHRRESAAHRADVAADLGDRPRRGNPHAALGMLDILCWDVKSQHAKMPIYQMLGGDDRVVPAYASTVTWPTMDEYERYIKMSRDLGFKAFKLHAWGDVKRDIELCDQPAQVGRRRCRPDVRRLGRLGLRQRAGVRQGDPGSRLPLVRGADARVPSRRLHQALRQARHPDPRRRNLGRRAWNMATWIEAKALDMTRVSSFYKGGFTGSMKVAHLSESHGMRAQVHGMGLENAQICAAISNNDYYEQLIIERGADQRASQARSAGHRRWQSDGQRRARARLPVRLGGARCQRL